MLITDITFSIYKKTLLIYKSSFLIKHIFVDNWSAYTIIVEVTINLEGVEVVFFNTIWCWYLTSFIDVLVVKHLFVLIIFEDIPCILIFQISPFIDRSASLVNIVSSIIL